MTPRANESQTRKMSVCFRETIKSHVDRFPIFRASARRAAREDACAQRSSTSGRRHPSTVGSRKSTSEFRNRSPTTRTQPGGRTHHAACRGSMPTGSPTGCGRSRTRPLGASCTPACSQRASAADRSVPGDVPGVPGDHRDRGRCPRTRRIRAEVASCRACRHGWAQLWSIRGRGRRFPAGALSCVRLYWLAESACGSPSILLLI